MVQILEDEHHGTRGREAGEHRQDPAPDLGRVVAVLLAALLAVPQRQPDPAGGPLDLVRVDPLRHHLTDPPGHGLLAVDLADLADEHLPERRERPLLLERARPSDEDLHALGQPRQELLGHPRLPDAGFAEQRHEVRAFAGRHAVEGVGEQRELAAPVHERHPLAVRPPARSQREDGPGRHRAAHTFGIDPSRLAELHLRGGELRGRRADEDLARGGRLLEPRADVHLGPEHDVAVGRRPHGDRAGVHADPDLHGRRQPQLAPQPRGLIADRERGAHRAGGVVVVGDRRAEGPEHGVADEPLGDPAEPRDLLAHHPVEPGQDLAEPLGIDGGRQLRGTGEVDEDDRDDPPFRGVRDGEGGAARGAEAGVGRQGLPAAGALGRGHRASIVRVARRLRGPSLSGTR